MNEIINILENHFGKQDWWHYGRFPDKMWEICAGAILTQNTNLKNVEKALDRMKERNFLTYNDVLKAHIRKIENALRPSGFYRQKARRLKLLAKYIDSSGGMDKFAQNVSRDQLLSLKGIGNETADSILLYALGRDEFVVDSYTIRILSRIGTVGEDVTYMELKNIMQKNVPKKLYKDMHAWIVELAKSHCRKEPLCMECPLKDLCKTGIKRQY